MHKLLHILHALKLWCLYPFVRNNARFVADMARWGEWKQCPYQSKYWHFVFLMAEYREFRNICYYRMGKAQYLLCWICPPLDSLYIHCKDIGGDSLSSMDLQRLLLLNELARMQRFSNK